MSTVVVRNSPGNPGCLIQLLWFVFIGWWAGQIWIALAWILMLTVVGIPFGVMMLNEVPRVIALRGQPSGFTVTTRGDGATVIAGSVPQRNILVRAVYFVLIGWWLSAVWMELAYVICLTIIGLPLGFWMFDKVPALVSLHQS